MIIPQVPSEKRSQSIPVTKSTAAQNQTKKAGISTVQVEEIKQSLSNANLNANANDPKEPKKRGRKKASESEAKGSSGGNAQKSGKKKIKLRDSNSFQTYIFRVMKEIKPELGISKKGIELINNIVVELFEKIMKEARDLTIFTKKQTLSSKEIETAIKLHFPGELQKLAIQTCRHSLQKYSQNNNN